MNKYILSFFIASLFLLAACSSNQPSSQQLKNFEASNNIPTQNHDQLLSEDYGTKKGEKAHDFTVSTIDHNVFQLSSQKKPTLVYFFATWCPHCSNDFREINKVYPKYKDDVDFIAMTLDQKESPEKLEDYKNKLNINHVQFAKADKTILSNYAVRYTTTKYAVSRDGTILYTSSGEVDADTWEIIFKGLKES